jgi:hypothetical protein
MPADASPPSHFIAPHEVAAWLVGSVVQVVTYHRTTAAHAAVILSRGVRIERSNPEATWGQGFYSAIKPDSAYGEASLTVAVRLTHPWIVRDTIRAVEELELLMEKHGVQDRRSALLREGYNGVVVYFGPEDLWAVAFHNEQVRIVLERGHAQIGILGVEGTVLG